MSQSCEVKGHRASLDCMEGVQGLLTYRLGVLHEPSRLQPSRIGIALAGRCNEVLAKTAGGRDIAGRSKCACQKTRQSWTWLILQSLEAKT